MAAVQQQESTLIVGTITGSGDATFTITKAGMTGTPLAVSVAVLITDTATITAGKAATALNLVANFAAVCLAYSVGATLYVMVLTAAANDSTMNIAYTNGTCTGLTADATSDHAAIGDAGTVTNGYTTLAEVKTSKRISTSNSGDDAFIEGLIESASRYIDNVTGRRFYTTTADETRTFTADGGVIYPGDLLSVTTLKTDEDGDRTYEVTWTTGDYDLLPENAALDGRPYVAIDPAPDGDYGFPTQRKGVQIVGKFGFCTLANRPEDIGLACRMIVISEYLKRYGVSSEGAATITGAGVVITPKAIPVEAMEIINRYRRDLLP